MSREMYEQLKREITQFNGSHRFNEKGLLEIIQWLARRVAEEQDTVEGVAATLKAQLEEKHDELVKANRAKGAAEARAKKYKQQLDELKESKDAE